MTRSPGYPSSRSSGTGSSSAIPDAFFAGRVSVSGGRLPAAARAQHALGRAGDTGGPLHTVRDRAPAVSLRTRAAGRGRLETFGQGSACKKRAQALARL